MTENEINIAYEWETGKIIVEAFERRDPTRTPAVLVQYNWPFTWGSSGTEAVQHALALEIVADMAAKTLLLNPTQVEIPSVLHQKHFNRKHGAGAY